MEEVKQIDDSDLPFEQALEIIQLITDSFKEHILFLTNKFNDKYRDKKYHINNDEAISYCCDENDISVIYNLGNAIKKISPYNTLTFNNIYFILIYLIYNLRTDPMFNRMNNGGAFKYVLSKGTNGEQDLEKLRISRNLYTTLFMGELMYEGRNLSSEVRRKFSEMAGGFKKHKTRRYRRRKLNKRHKTKKNNKTNKPKKNKKFRSD